MWHPMLKLLFTERAHMAAGVRRSQRAEREVTHDEATVCKLVLQAMQHSHGLLSFLPQQAL